MPFARFILAAKAITLLCSIQRKDEVQIKLENYKNERTNFTLFAKSFLTKYEQILDQPKA